MLPLRWTEHAVMQRAGKFVPEKDDATLKDLVSPPSRIFYRPRDECIEVLAIVHGRQLLDDAF